MYGVQLAFITCQKVRLCGGDYSTSNLLLLIGWCFDLIHHARAKERKCANCPMTTPCLQALPSCHSTETSRFVVSLFGGVIVVHCLLTV